MCLNAIAPKEEILKHCKRDPKHRSMYVGYKSVNVCQFYRRKTLVLYIQSFYLDNEIFPKWNYAYKKDKFEMLETESDPDTKYRSGIHIYSSINHARLETDFSAYVLPVYFYENDIVVTGNEKCKKIDHLNTIYPVVVVDKCYVFELDYKKTISDACNVFICSPDLTEQDKKDLKRFVIPTGKKKSGFF